MKKRLVKPAFRVWWVWLSALVISLISFWADIPNVTNSSGKIDFLLAFTTVGLISFFFDIPAIIIALVLLKQENIRQAAAQGDGNRTHIIADKPALLEVPFPIKVLIKSSRARVVVATNLFIGGTLFFSLLGFLLLLSISQADSREIITSQAIATLLLLGVPLIAAFYLYFLDRSSITLSVGDAGIAIQRRWTNTQIPWQDIHLFWSLNRKPITAANALVPTAYALYEVASATKRIVITIYPRNYNGIIFDNPTTYYDRMGAILSVIIQKSGVPLREPLPQQPKPRMRLFRRSII